MYRIAVCDDKKEDLKEICDMVEAIMPSFGIDYEVNRFSSIQQLLEAFDRAPYQLILLDILFEGPEGITWAQSMRRRGYDCAVILISSSTDYLLAGYDIHAVNYIVKPPERDKLCSAIRYALRHGPQRKEKITLHTGGGLRVIEQQDIVYLESANHDVLFHIEGGGTVKCRGRLDEFAQQLGGIATAQCHKSFLINLARVRAVRYGCVELDSGARLPVSRNRLHAFKRAYFDYQITD